MYVAGVDLVVGRYYGSREVEIEGITNEILLGPLFLVLACAIMIRDSMHDPVLD